MTEKTCSSCKKIKPISEFAKNRNNRDGLYYSCKPCHNQRQNGYVEADRERYRAQKRETARKLRNDVIDGYGAKCTCCGETERKFLTLDHVNNDGASQRRSMSQTSVYADARRRGFPPEYQLLCFNCNCSKGFYGICPHQEENPKIS